MWSIISSKKKPQPSIKRTRYTLLLSWACTVHEFQGLSLKEVVIGFETERQISFNQGQMYHCTKNEVFQ